MVWHLDVTKIFMEDSIMKQHKLIAGGLTIALLLAACAAPTSESPTSIPATDISPSTQPTTVIEGTASAEGQWQEYSANGEFTFSYPIDVYSVETGPANAEALAPGIIEIEPNDATNMEEPLTQTYKISVAVHENTDGLSMDNPNQLLAQGGLLVQYDSALLDATHPVETYTINGVPAFRVNNLPAGQSGSVTQIMTIHNGKIYEWLIEPAQVNGDMSNQPIVEEILDSFQLAA
jgi:hypothetical protein